MITVSSRLNLLSDIMGEKNMFLKSMFLYISHYFIIIDIISERKKKNISSEEKCVVRCVCMYCVIFVHVSIDNNN